MSSRIKDVLNGILERFESGEIPDAVAYSTFPVQDTPSSRWSFLNRLLMSLSGTADARGFRQWTLAKRRVKKGAKAIYILVPKMSIIKNDDDEDESIVTGFLAKPVFRVEDTVGQPLEYQKIELPELPLMEKAKEWEIAVKAVPGNSKYYGYFSKSEREIGLASKDETIFFHELSHYAHSKLSNGKDKAEKWQKEIIAELSAAALCKLVGKSSKFLGSNYQYIRHYAKEANLSPIKSCLKVLNEVEAILKLVLSPSGNTIKDSR
jgi:hypothetical protein